MRGRGLLVGRLVVGAVMAGHGAQKLFGLFGGKGPAGTGEVLESLGYQRGRDMAVVAGATEVCSGAGLMLGFLTPLAAAGLIGEMVNAGAVHRSNGLWAENGGYEYPLTLAASAAVLAFDGPGSPSVDEALQLSMRGPRWGVGACLLGVATGTLFTVLAKRPAALADD